MCYTICMDNIEKKKVKNLILEVIAKLNYDPSDVGLQKYLYEKGMKAFEKINYRDYSLEKVRKLIMNNVDKMMEEYSRMKSIIDEKKLEETNFGVNINYQLIELFNLLKLPANEFEIRKRQYLNSQPMVFEGISECNFEQLKNIYNNIIENCDVITPEGEAKMFCTIKSVNPFNSDGTVNEAIFNFSYLDIIVNFAKENNMKVRLHTLVWHKYFPKILYECSKSQIITFLDAYFKAIVKRYGENIFYTIDVLNEICADIYSDEFKQGKVLRKSMWEEKLGDDYYLTVLKIARKNFPHSKLAYNEYDETNKEKRGKIISIIDNIKVEEKRCDTTLLDVIGLQSHYHEYIQDDDIKQTFSDFAKTGKMLQVSEMDVVKINNQNDIQANRVFRTVLDCACTYNVDSFTCWGPTSSISWKSKKVRTFLNNDGKIDDSCKNIVETYSQKNKSKNFNNLISSNLVNKNLDNEKCLPKTR